MTEALWTGAEVIAATGGRGDADWQAQGVSIDTRTLEAGDLFVALAGDNHDGHDYLADAFARGASAALVSEDYAGALMGAMVAVPDVLAGLRALGEAARRRSTAHIVAITGSVGKTGTKEALRRALSKTAATHASRKSYNNHVGVPLSLAALPADAAYGVFELGMNHAGEIDALTRLVRPHTAVITHIGEAHIENLGSLEGIARAKAEIFAGLEAGGTAIIPRDSEFFDLLRSAAATHEARRIIGFGHHEEADIRVVRQYLHPTCSCVSAEMHGQAITFKVGAAGAHHVSNALAVLGAVEAAGADLAFATLSFADMGNLAGRGARHEIETRNGRFTLIDESYNANPASMHAALTALGLVPRPGQARRIAVLGDMVELGDAARDCHADLARVVEQADIDMVFTCGALMRHLHDHLPPGRTGAHAETPDALLPPLLAELHAHDVVMVKGSRATGMEVIVEGLLNPENGGRAVGSM